VALEIESIPAILDLVLQGDCHAVLAENAIRTSGQPGAFQLRPIGPPRLVATLWMATSAQRPRGPLIEQGVALVRGLLQELWIGSAGAAGSAAAA
jgi:LysR family nitrogen assimilation transcriptional regulator